VKCLVSVKWQYNKEERNGSRPLELLLCLASESMRHKRIPLLSRKSATERSGAYVTCGNECGDCEAHLPSSRCGDHC